MSRARLMVHLLLVTLLTGCMGGGEDDLDASGSDDPVLVKDPDDYSYLDDEDNADRGHLHDYWNGQEAVVIMDRQTTMGALVVERSVEVGKLRPDEGQTVLLGTARVEVTVEWEDHPPVLYGPVELWVKTAAMEAAEPVTEVQNGDTVVIASTNDDNDLPHQHLSGWSFSLVARPAEADPGVGLIWFGADVTMSAIAYRGLDIPLFPPHPDHWNGTDRLVLHDEDVQVTLARGGTDGQACLSPCLTMALPDDGKIVPPATEMVEVVVRYDDLTTQRLSWAFHGGDTWTWTEMTTDTDDGTTTTFRIPVAQGMADGPYAKQSLWEFHPFTPGDLAGVDPTAPTDAVFRGDYHVTITATRSTGTS